ncbi:hypothetical protein SSSM5_057 [Synechococcus phage S-SSM5]|uniref:Uncharacterized protein n=1 Tax=Synechococcus phage S-SSM5 TaxID=445685 RepID=E3SK97_9CAUD|nr:hypothetical protein SSSM5_057 [Synechococcus phage S-SSM5]ADO98013.1 hypothetical protein SSSM5_057 [Synechococcus phage S-SSM5]
MGCDTCINCPPPLDWGGVLYYIINVGGKGEHRSCSLRRTSPTHNSLHYNGSSSTRKQIRRHRNS